MIKLSTTWIDKPTSLAIESPFLEDEEGKFVQFVTKEPELCKEFVYRGVL